MLKFSNYGAIIMILSYISYPRIIWYCSRFLLQVSMKPEFFLELAKCLSKFPRAFVISLLVIGWSANYPMSNFAHQQLTSTVLRYLAKILIANFQTKEKHLRRTVSLTSHYGRTYKNFICKSLKSIDLN